MSEKQQKKIDELRHDIQKIKKSVEAIAIDVTQSKNLTVATGHYLEEVAKMVKDLAVIMHRSGGFAAVDSVFV